MDDKPLADNTENDVLLVTAIWTGKVGVGLSVGSSGTDGVFLTNDNPPASGLNQCPGLHRFVLCLVMRKASGSDEFQLTS